MEFEPLVGCSKSQPTKGNFVITTFDGVNRYLSNQLKPNALENV